MEPVSKLFDTLKGKPAAIIGGGPTSPDDLRKLPEGCFIIGLNHHWKGLVYPDLVVAADDWKTAGRGYGLVGKKGNLMFLMADCPIVGQNPDMDYSFDGLKTKRNKTAFLAVEIAKEMGAGDIYLVGMDCYQTGSYWYDKDAPLNPIFKDNVDAVNKQVAKWKRHYSGAGLIPLSGPLVGAI